jgi:hypothetical protein
MNTTLKQSAAHVLTHHPNEKLVYATSDNTIFLEREKNSAYTWAKEKGLEPVLLITRDIAFAEEKAVTPEGDALPEGEATPEGDAIPEGEASPETEEPIKVIVPKL